MGFMNTSLNNPRIPINLLRLHEMSESAEPYAAAIVKLHIWAFVKIIRIKYLKKHFQISMRSGKHLNKGQVLYYVDTRIGKDPLYTVECSFL